MPWLASFVAVAEHGTFTAAARAMYRSQPRISMHVSALERELGIELLERTSQGVRLTEAGARFIPHARAVLTELRVGIDRVEPLAGGLHGLVAVGSYPGASAVLLAPFIRRFRSQHPGVSVKLHDGTPTWMDDAVSHGEVDFAIRSAEVPRRFHELAWQPLLEESIMLVVPQQHPLATGDPLDVGVLREETIISTGDLTAGWADYREPLASIGVATDRLEVVAGPTTLVAMVQAGLGVGLLGEMAAEVTLHGDVIARELPRPVWKRDIHISTSTSRRLSAAATIFRDEFVDHCAHRRM
jgi:LysR family transcriptional regulator, carnitine catabolism transcriptional activator